MTQTLPELKLYTFDEFIEWYPNDGKRYELHNGVIIEMPPFGFASLAGRKPTPPTDSPPTGDHEKVIAFLARKLTVEFDRLGLPYGIPKTVFVKTPETESTYSPDIPLLNLDNLHNEPFFEKQSTVIYPDSLPIVIEVVSTNWQDDYYHKFGNYEKMGILEYWITDYKALGGRKFIGNPKVPTIFVCELIDGEYQMTPFTGTNRIVSPTFPQLNLTAQQVFDAVI